MKTLRALPFILAFLTAAFFLPQPAQAEEGLKIAVVDMQFVMQQSTAGKSVRDKLDKQREKYMKQIKAKEDELLSMEEELKRQRGVAKPEEFDKKRAEFEKQISAAQAEANKLKASLERAYNDAMTKLRGETAKIIADVAKAQGVSVVLSRQSVVLAEKSLDITPQVVESLNKTLKDIPVSW